MYHLDRSVSRKQTRTTNIASPPAHQNVPGVGPTVPQTTSFRCYRSLVATGPGITAMSETELTSSLESSLLLNLILLSRDRGRSRLSRPSQRMLEGSFLALHLYGGGYVEPRSVVELGPLHIARRFSRGALPHYEVFIGVAISDFMSRSSPFSMPYRCRCLHLGMGSQKMLFARTTNS